jgi:hypothetical protein
MKPQSLVLVDIDINAKDSVCEHFTPRFVERWLEKIETAVTRFLDTRYRQRGAAIVVAERDMRTADGQADSYAVEVHSGSPNEDLEASFELQEMIDASYVGTSEMAEFDSGCPICADASSRGGWRHVLRAIVIPPRTVKRPGSRSR